MSTKINKTIIFFRSQNTGEVLNCVTAYPEGAKLAPFEIPSIWRSVPLTCGTQEAEDVLAKLTSAWNDEYNKRFKLPVVLDEDISVTYEEVESMRNQLYRLTQMSDAEAFELFGPSEQDAENDADRKEIREIRAELERDGGQ